MQNTENIVIPMLKGLQQCFHAVPRFSDPNKRYFNSFAEQDSKVTDFVELQE